MVWKFLKMSKQKLQYDSEIPPLYTRELKVYVHEKPVHECSQQH